MNLNHWAVCYSGQNIISGEFIFKCILSTVCSVDLFIVEFDILFIYIFAILSVHKSIQYTRWKHTHTQLQVDWFGLVYLQRHTQEKHIHKYHFIAFTHKSICLFVFHTVLCCYYCCCWCVYYTWMLTEHRTDSVSYTQREREQKERKTFLTFLRNSQSQSFWFHLLLLRHSLFRSNYLFMTITYVIVMPSWCWNK